jgi:pimeloyl-ACP methyl ester carboxylesterase
VLEEGFEPRDRRGTIAGLPVFWRETEIRPERSPVLYLHGVPTHSDDWLPFLARTGGLAPDLPGFGRSGKPADFDYSIDGYDRFLGSFLDHLGVERFSLVVHDWGAVGLALAQRAPERLERLVIANAVPFLPGYDWHWIAQIWRRRGLGELFMGLSTRWGFRQLSRQSRAAGTPPSDELVDRVWDHFDHGTQRAILRLYRSADPPVLAAAGRRLSAITCPALVLWGEQDPYLDTAFARAYASALGGQVDLVVAAGANHWPWLDRPELVDKVTDFLVARDGEPGATV